MTTYLSCINTYWPRQIERRSRKHLGSKFWVHSREMQIFDSVTVRSLPSNKSQCFTCLGLMSQPLVPGSTCCCCSMGTGCSAYLLDIEEWSSPAAPPMWNPSRPIRSRLPPRLSWWKKDLKSEVRFCFLPHPSLKLFNHCTLSTTPPHYPGGSFK